MRNSTTHTPSHAGEESLRVNARAAPAALESCEIVWWRGYVTGRFQAYAGVAGERELIAESPAIRWRSSTPPEPTEAAVAALDALTHRLSKAGWQSQEGQAHPGFGLRLARPALAETQGPAQIHAATQTRARSRPAHELEPRLDVVLLAELRAQVDEARAAARHEHDRRLEAEAEALRLKEPPGPRPTQPLSVWVLVAAYAIAVLAAALVGLTGFGSIYGAVVAAMTTLAVVVAIDSWIVARRRTFAARRVGPRSERTR
jgi:hypothetical protein